MKFLRFSTNANKLYLGRYYSQSLNKRKLTNEKYRIRLAAAYRGLDKYGLNEGICNHLSAKVPSVKIDEEVMLIIPFGLHWKEVTPSSLIGIDKRNEVVEGNGVPELTALCIHKGIYDLHPHVKSIMHTHMPYSTSLTCLEMPKLRMLHQNSARFYNQIAYVPYGGLGDTSDEGLRLAKALESKQVLFMDNHGVLITANTIDIAFDNMYYLERAAMFQVLATSANLPLKELDEKTVKKTYEQVWETLPEYAETHLNSIIRQLNRSCDEFKII